MYSFQVNSPPPGGPRLRIVFDKAPQPSIIAVGSLHSSSVRGSGVCYNVSGGHMSWGLCRQMTDNITVSFADSSQAVKRLTLEVEARTDASCTAVISLYLNGTLIEDRQIKREAYAKYKCVLPDYILTSSENSANSLVVLLSAVGHSALPSPFSLTLSVSASPGHVRYTYDFPSYTHEHYCFAPKIPMQVATRDIHANSSPHACSLASQQCMTFCLGVTDGSHIFWSITYDSCTCIHMKLAMTHSHMRVWELISSPM